MSTENHQMIEEWKPATELPFDVLGPGGVTSRITIPVEWDAEIGEYLVMPDGFAAIEAEKRRLIAAEIRLATQAAGGVV